MLAVFTVNSNLDDGGGANLTLREAIAQANQNLDHDTIQFAANLNNATITLTQGELSITNSVTIDGRDPDGVLRNITIHAGGGTDHVVGNFDGHAVFRISGAGGDVAINSLKLTGGDNDVQAGGGGISSIGMDVTIKNSDITGNASGSGGGISAEDGNLTIEYSTVTSNTTPGLGGGVYFFTFNGELNVISSTIGGNVGDFGGGGISASGYDAIVNIQSSLITGNQSMGNGGGLNTNVRELNIIDASQIHDNLCIGFGSGYSGGGGFYANVNNGSITIDQSTITENRATNYNCLGAGGYIQSSGSVVSITNTTIAGNKALGLETNVGGLSVVTHSNSNVLIEQSTITGNHADDDVGGLYVRNFGSVVTLARSTVSGNTASFNNAGSPNYGVGAWLITESGGQTVVRDSTISGNKVVAGSGGMEEGSGGGLCLDTRYGGVASIVNSTISGNEVAGSAGGIKIREDWFNSGEVQILHSTVTNNRANSNNDTAGTGGGIHVGSSTTTVELDHTIVAGNFRGAGSTRDDISGAVAAAWSLIGDNTGATITNNGGNQIGDASTPIDPYLLPLAFNGGLTMTHALQAFSSARNMGDPSAVPGVNDVPQFDQRGAGFSRKVGARVDIGAYEADTAGVCVSTLIDEFDQDRSYGDLSLREAVNYANNAGEATTICLPAGLYQLTLSGSGGVSQGDLDVTGNVTIVGDGPGLSIIDASTLASDDRIFDVANLGVLGISHATLALGAAPTAAGQRDGGAVRVQDGGQFDLDYSAVVGNETTRSGYGGAIYFAATAHGSITDSVITVNYADNMTGGVYLKAASSPGTGGTVTVTRSIIVNNTASSNSYTDVYAGANRTFTSGGHNRLGNVATGFSDGVNGDYIKPTGTTVDYVVTSVVDNYTGTADLANLSLRDAIHLANTTAGTQEIWLPAWAFVLTRQRTTAYNLPELNVSEGDIEITESLILRGIGGAGGPATSVSWMPGAAADKVFELVGDYNGNGVVEAGTADYVVWRDQENQTGSNLAADGNDDGVVNELDRNLCLAHNGNTLLVDDILAV